MEYYVYVGRYEGQVMYIGKGKGERLTHLNSGRSGCYLANKHHFEGKAVDVERVATGLSESDALELEALLITEANPKWNIIGGQAPLIKRPQEKKRTVSTSQYFGVSLKNGAWLARHKVGGRSVHIGTFDSEIEAAKERDKYLLDNDLPGTLNF